MQQGSRPSRAGEQPRKAEGGSHEKKRVNREPRKHQISAQNMVDQHAGLIAEHLDAVPGAEEAFREGRFGFRSAAVLARCVEQVGRDEVADDVATDLLDYALRLWPDSGTLENPR